MMSLTGKQKKLIAFSGALCMLLSAVEYAIPKPVPFMRLGLANLPILLALYTGLSVPEYFTLVLLKILTQALVSGTLFSYVFLFSLAGSLSSAAIMLLLFKADRKRRAFSATGICLGGALANNLAQIALSYLLLFGESTRYIAPVLLIAGAITAVLLGLFAETFMKRSRWFAVICSEVASESVVHNDGANQYSTPAGNADCADKTENVRGSGGTVRFVIGLCVMLVFLFVKSVCIKAVLTVIFYGAARIRRKKVRILPPLIILLTVTMAALLTPAGRVLVRVGNFPVTLGALETGLMRALTLVGMVFISQYATSGKIKLRGKAGQLFESVLDWFSVLSATRLTFKKGRVVETLDAHLSAVYFKED